MRCVFIESECICSLVQVLLHGRGLHSILPCPSAKALVAFCWLFQKLPMPPKRNAASLADLQANCARIDQDIASLRTELRNRRRREAYTHQIPKMVDTAAKILWCRHHKLDHLMKFLRFKTGADTKDLERWAAAVTSWFTQASPEQRTDMGNADKDPSLRRAAAEVVKYCQEQALHEWVVGLNVNLGVSPATGTLLNELGQRGMERSSNKFAGEKRKYRSSLQFLRRWRSRWSVKLGKFDTLDFEEPKELQQKAPAAPSIDPARTHRLAGNGTTGRCPAGNQPEKNSGRFLATISVPHCWFLTEGGAQKTGPVFWTWAVECAETDVGGVEMV